MVCVPHSQGDANLRLGQRFLKHRISNATPHWVSASNAAPRSGYVLTPAGSVERLMGIVLLSAVDSPVLS